MITENEIDEWAERFGVPAAQIERDHLVSLTPGGDPGLIFVERIPTLLL